jgi:uncharacterized protein
MAGGAPCAWIGNVASDSPENGKMTAAHQAVEHGQLDELTRLLDAGTDPNEVSADMTLLLHAIDVEADGAAQTGEPIDAACTAVLLAYGADPERPGPHGEIPRLFAFHAGHGLAVRLIEAHIRRKGVLVDPCPALSPSQPQTF